MTLRPLLLSLIAAALLMACATSSSRRAAQEQPQRVPDSAPDKAAATRAAAGLHLEEEDQRWGIEAAKARKQNQEPAKAAPPTNASPSTGITGPTSH